MNVNATFRFKECSDIISFYDAPKKVRLANKKSPLELAIWLYEENDYDNCIAFISRALDNRSAILWCWLCFRYSFIDLTTEEWSAINSIREWLISNDPSTRQEMEHIAKSIEYESSIAWLCQSVFWSGGSITDEDAPPLEPPDHLLSHAVYGAMKLATLLKQGEKERPNLEKQYAYRGIKLITIASKRHP